MGPAAAGSNGSTSRQRVGKEWSKSGRSAAKRCFAWAQRVHRTPRTGRGRQAPHGEGSVRPTGRVLSAYSTHAWKL